jgi:hypothetical protein
VVCQKGLAAVAGLGRVRYGYVPVCISKTWWKMLVNFMSSIKEGMEEFTLLFVP